MSISPAVTAYLVLSLLCGIINIAPTASHLRQGHSGPGAFGVWVVLLNIFDSSNAFLWRHDAIDRAPVFCDISIKITAVGPLGLLIANCCIIRYLATIVTPHRSLEDHRRRRHRQVFDYSLSFGLPCIVAGSSFLYQVARYQVNRQTGCSPVSALVWPTLILALIWPPICSGIACGYSVYVMYWLIRRHRDLRELVEKSDATLNLARFTRMGALSATYLCISAPCTIIGIYATLQSLGPYIPWGHWSQLHNRDNRLTAVRQDPLYELAFRDWLPVFAGVTIFLFFSFGKESLIIYTQLYRMMGMNDCLRRSFAVIVKQSTQHPPMSLHDHQGQNFGPDVLSLPSNATKAISPHPKSPNADLSRLNPLYVPTKSSVPHPHQPDPIAIHVSIVRQSSLKTVSD